METWQAETGDSQRRFYLAFENAPLGMLVRDIATGRLQPNKALLQMLGYHAKALDGAGFEALMRPEGHRLDAALDAELSAGKRDAYQIERSYLHQEGHTVWCKADVSLVRDDEGKPQFSVSVFEEITERKHAEISFKRLVSRYEQILNVAEWGVCGIGRDGMIAFANPAASAMLGWSADALIGQPATALCGRVATQSCRDAGCMMCDPLRDGLIRHADNDTFLRRDGTRFSVKYTATPIIEDGLVNGVVVLFVGIARHVDSMPRLP